MSDSESKSKKNSRAYVVLFSLVVSLICSLLITAAATGLKGFQDENIALDKKINLLKAAGMLPPGKKPPKEEINRLFDTRIQEVVVDRQGKILKDTQTGAMSLYLVKSDKSPEQIDGYIIPIDTRGLWGKIMGYLAFENDGQTVAGFSVYSHSETPGLGGEIESTWFQKNFVGKKIYNSIGKFVSVRIAKGKTENLPKDVQPNYVDGISGATLTGKFLSEGLEQTLEQYEGVSVSFKQRGAIPVETKAQN